MVRRLIHRLSWRHRARRVLLVLFLVGGCSDPAAGNEPPAFLTSPPPVATVYQPYVYEVACADPDGDLVTLHAQADDTCGGQVTDHGNRRATYRFVPGFGLAGGSCRLALACRDLQGLESQQVADLSVQPPLDLTELRFGSLAPWDEPLTDYIDAATQAVGARRFLRGIHGLATFEDRLYLGYGDADVNIGRHVPIEVRAYDHPEPAAWTTHFVTDEEQIAHYRVAGGRLVIPGVDATEDALLGNVYTLDATGWSKRRSLQWAWHVHDVAGLDGVLYAVGSGGTMDDYHAASVKAFLWQSQGDAPFTVLAGLEHPSPPGDHRLTRLLAVDGTLYAFGYYSAEGTSYGLRYRLVGDILEPYATGALASFFVFDTHPLGQDPQAPAAGLLVGVNIGASLTWGARRLAGGEVQALPVLEDHTILAADSLTGLPTHPADPHGGARILLLLLDGDAYPTPNDGPFDVTLAILGADGSLSPLLSQTLDVLPLSLAFWRESLYVGLKDGSLWRSVGAS